MGDSTASLWPKPWRERVLYILFGLAFVGVALAGVISEGASSPRIVVPPPVLECPFGYFDRPGDMTARCEPAEFRVQSGDTFSHVAEAWGSARSWKLLCTVEQYGPVIVRTRATLANDQDLHPDQLVMLCAPDDAFADPRHDQHRPSSTDA